MDYFRIVFILTVIFNYNYADRGRLHMVASPMSLTMPINDEAELECKMNINADEFSWNYYPLPTSQATNTKAAIDLRTAKPIQLNKHMYETEKKSTKLSIKSLNASVAGDYQCVAYYGASAIASAPGRITITHIEKFTKQDNIYETVSAGNTIVYKCDPPLSNPPAYIDYYKDKNHITPMLNVPKTQSLILYNVSTSDTGVYNCSASNNIENKRVYSDFSFHLKVVNNAHSRPPYFIIPPKDVYTVEKGEEVFLECAAVGTPVPTVTWQKINGELSAKRTEMLGGGLRIFNVTADDGGVYICKYTNTKGTITHNITLKYREAPTIIEGPKNTNMSEGEHLDLECYVKGTPEPIISWFLNGKSVINDTAIEVNHNKITFKPLQKRHAGILQFFVSNEVGIKYSIAELRVIPRQISSTDVIEDYFTQQPTHKRRKHRNKKKKGPKTAQMIPPSKPTVSRLNDESVVVRWTVPTNSGLPIQFFKVQYQELFNINDTQWKTCNQDIPPNIRSYEVNNLKPDQIYKFRIAAVYSNNDNKLSPKSDKFYLNRTDFFTKNILPVPRLFHTEKLNSTAIKIEWEYTPTPNVTIDGFLISYQSASTAGEYMKATVDGESVNSYIITHLQPDTVYDIKIQSFTTKSASEFSPILKQSTAKLFVENPTTTSIPSTNVVQEFPIVYIIIIIVIVGVIVIGIIICLVCRKCKCDNNMEDINHHYPTEDNDYGSPRSFPRTNGVTPNPRMTITSNPLADADNKNQNVMEMSCLSLQNNNCSTVEPSPTTNNRETRNESISKKGKINNKKRHDLRERENYV